MLLDLSEELAHDWTIAVHRARGRLPAARRTTLSARHGRPTARARPAVPADPDRGAALDPHRTHRLQRPPTPPHRGGPLPHAPAPSDLGGGARRAAAPWSAVRGRPDDRARPASRQRGRDGAAVAAAHRDASLFAPCPPLRRVPAPTRAGVLPWECDVTHAIHAH